MKVIIQVEPVERAARSWNYHHSVYWYFVRYQQVVSLVALFFLVLPKHGTNNSVWLGSDTRALNTPTLRGHSTWYTYTIVDRWFGGLFIVAAKLLIITYGSALNRAAADQRVN